MAARRRKPIVCAALRVNPVMVCKSVTSRKHEHANHRKGWAQPIPLTVQPHHLVHLLRE